MMEVKLLCIYVWQKKGLELFVNIVSVFFFFFLVLVLLRQIILFVILKLKSMNDQKWYIVHKELNDMKD